MRLLSCYVENFGALHERTFTFSEGLNQFLAENGSGKSTLLAFLRAMLYGLPASTKQNPQENDRRHYTPWQGGRFGGSLTFEARGRRYTATRVFGQKESDDYFGLFFADTKAASEDFSTHLGEELFSVSSDAFMKSAAIPSFEKDRFAACGSSVSEKLSRYIEDTDGAVSYDDAIKTLEKQRKVYIKTGNKGLLPEGEERLDRLRMALLEAEKSAASADELQARIVAMQKERALLSHEEEALAERILAAGRAESTGSLTKYGATLQREAASLRCEAEEMRRRFGDALPDEAELLMAEKESMLLSSREAEEPLHEGDRNALLDYRERFGTLPPTEEEITRLARAAACSEEGGRRRRKPMLLILAVFFLLLTAVSLVFLFWPAAVVLLPLSAVFGFLYIRSGAESEKEKTAFSVSYGLLRADAERYRALLSLQEERRTAIEQRRLEDEEKSELLTRYFASYGEGHAPLSVMAASLRRRLGEYTALCERVREADARADAFLREHPDIQAANLPVGDATPCNETADALTQRRADMRRRLSVLDGDIRTRERLLLPLRENAARAEEYRREMALLSEKCAVYRRTVAAIEGAEKLLTAAKEALSLRYLSSMQAALERYMARFMPHFGGAPVLSSDLSLKMKSGSVRLSPLFYSDGTQDILSFCMHMALSDALFTEEQPPLFFDDSFLSWDDAKMAAGLRFLSELSKTRQILYFTCQEGRLAPNLPTSSFHNSI